MTDLVKLEEYICDSGLKSGVIAESLNISRQSFWNKRNGKTDFSVSEINTLCHILKINNSDRNKIFFAN